MHNFELEYKKLNPKQREAVDSIDGPVLVVAGPGTGKTQLLSARVANILKKTDTDPSNILCLTFTNKAAMNMRERLHKLIGNESRYINVRTFHSFSADIMNDYSDYFWNGARLSVAPDAVQLEIVQNILARLPLSNPLTSSFSGEFTQLGDITQALKLAKEAGLTPDDLNACAKANLSYIDTIEPILEQILSKRLSLKTLPIILDEVGKLPKQKVARKQLLLPLDQVLAESLELAINADHELGKTTNTGKWKRRWLQTIEGQKVMADERRRNEWWLAVAGVYQAYREQLHKAGYYDYSDMLVEVIEQLEANPNMLADVQERFQYVLIDEFQDTNAAQLRLAHLVADHYAANNRPNLMAVGDDDQSIFAFNGAELNNMLEFKRSYPDTKLIVLEYNYRSAQKVLDTSRQIIEQAGDRLVKRQPDLTKNLNAKNEPDGQAEISHLSYPTKEHQRLAVAERVKELWQDNSGSIAVLARQHDSLVQIASALHDLNVPIRYERKANVLEHEAVKQVYTVASLVTAIAEGDKLAVNEKLAVMLRHPMWNVSSKTLWQLATSNFTSPDWLGSLLNHADPELNSIGSWLTWLARTQHNQPLPLTLEHLLGLRESEYLTSPFKDYYLSKQKLSSTYLETLSAVNLLIGMTKEFAGNNLVTLADLVRFMTLNLNTNHIIADESWFVSSHRAVELLTIYKAKGLEFDHVFVVDAVEDMWKPRRARRKSPANLKLEAYGEKYDDYVRLLYVAASRAKQTITATSYFTGDKGEELLPTPLLSAFPIKVVDKPTQLPQAVLETNISWPRLDTTDEQALLSTRLENFSLTVSGLLNFLDLSNAGPGSFLERNLLHVPTAHSASGSYGTAVHAALETAQRLVNTVGMEVSTVIDRFETTLQNEHLTPLELELYSNKGKELLTKLLSENLLELPKGSLAEQSLSDITIGNARVRGTIDRIDTKDNKQLVVVDYKTGKPLPSLETKDQSKALKAWRHKTQLTFYCLMAANSSRFRNANDISAQIVYLEADNKPKVLSFKPSTEELKQMTKLINAVWKHVTTLDLPDVSGYSPDVPGIQAFIKDLLN